MENNCLVSVIIPVFNVAPFINEALDSVIGQTYENLEIILIDDGSTDGSSQICDEYAEKDRRVRVIHQENRGLSAARNAGLDIMTGVAVAFLDPDDKYLPGYVQIMLSAMLTQSADIVMCKRAGRRTLGELTLKGTDRKIPAISEGLYGREAALRARADGTVRPNVWDKLYRSELWRDIRFPEGRLYEDIATMYKVIDLCESFYVVDEILYIRRFHRESITGDPTPESITDCIWALSQFGAFIEDNIPGIFDAGHLDEIRRRKLGSGITSYIRLFGIKKGSQAALAELRNRIIECGTEEGIQGLRFRRKIGFLVIRYCPWLIRIVYPLRRLFRPIKRKLRSVMRKLKGNG